MSMNDQDLLKAIKQVVSDEHKLLEEKLDAKFDAKLGSLESRIDGKIGLLDEKIDAKLGSLENKIDSKFDSFRTEILTKLEEQTEELRTVMTISFDAVQEELNDHDHRITKLETKAA